MESCMSQKRLTLPKRIIARIFGIATCLTRPFADCTRCHSQSQRINCIVFPLILTLWQVANGLRDSSRTRFADSATPSLPSSRIHVNKDKSVQWWSPRNDLETPNTNLPIFVRKFISPCVALCNLILSIYNSRSCMCR
jgi:hypothetical protein